MKESQVVGQKRKRMNVGLEEGQQEGSVMSCLVKEREMGQALRMAQTEEQ